MSEKVMQLKDMLLEGAIELRGTPSETAKTMKVKLSCRSDQPVSRVYGNLVHSIEGINRYKERYPLTYMHSETCIGYCNHFRVEEGQLVADGVLINNNEKANEIMTNLKDGVPYELSIVTDNMTMLEVEVGESFPCNNKMYEGPVYIALTSRLRAVGVVDMGADSNTDIVALNINEEQKVKIMKKGELKMENENVVEETSVDETEVVDETPAEETVAEETSLENETEEVSEESAPAPEETTEELNSEPVDDAELNQHGELYVDPREEFKALVDSFGAERAAKFFAEGVSLSQAKEIHYEELREEVKNLKEQVTLLQKDENISVTPSNADSGDQVYLAKENSYKSKVGNSSVAKLAARVQLPK